MFLIKSPNLQDFRVFQNCDRKKLRNPKEHIFQTYSYRKTDCKRTEFRCAYHTRCRRQKRRIPCKKSEKKKQKCIFGIRSFKKRCHFNFGKLYRNAVQAIGGCRGKYHHGICSRRSCDLGRYKASDLHPDFFYCQRFGFQLFLYQSAVHTSGLRSRISCHLFNYVFGGTAHKLACREVKRACETVCKGGLI